MIVAFHIVTFVFPIIAFSQSRSEDDADFRVAAEWLERKLNYYYFDQSIQKWWLNKFHINEEKEVTIKNISTNKPLSVDPKEKVYLIRTFKIRDINPYSFSIRTINKAQGRLVKGKLLELRTFDDQKKIKKTINGRKATPTSFLHLSFPTFLTDSLPHYAEQVGQKFSEAAISATKVYSNGSSEADRSQIFEIINGKFVSGSGEPIRSEKRFENVFSITINDGSQDFFGFDATRNNFFWTSITPTGIKTKFYRLMQGKQLV